jgi:Flp pilus assembly protein TadG
MYTQVFNREKINSLILTPNSLAKPAHQRGQAMVEFTLIFILLLVVAWIPADFGLAFYTGQLALNASREGARIAAADRNPPSGNPSCNLGSTCNSATGILKATADRMSSAMLPGATVQLTFPDSGSAATCDQTVRVSISGSYNFFFYQVLRLAGVNVGNSVPITRQTSMRWEHQC